MSNWIFLRTCVIILFSVVKGFPLCTWCILQWDQSLLQGLLDRWKVACLGQKCFQIVTTNYLHLCSTLHLTGAPQTPIKPLICKLSNTMYILSLHREVILQWLLTVFVWFIFTFLFGDCHSTICDLICEFYSELAKQ